VLFDKTQPQSPINRRISIVVMTKKAEEAALKTDVAAETPATTPATEPATPVAIAMPTAAAPARAAP
jgi:chemotaxis protein MotB